MTEMLFYIAGAAMMVGVFTLWCAISIERVRIAATKTQLYMSDHTLDQALLQWKYEYLVKQEKWLIELMCGKREEEKQEEKQ